MNWLILILTKSRTSQICLGRVRGHQCLVRSEVCLVQSEVLMDVYIEIHNLLWNELIILEIIFIHIKLHKNHTIFKNGSK